MGDDLFARLVVILRPKLEADADLAATPSAITESTPQSGSSVCSVSSVIEKSFSLKELELLAKGCGLKREGVNWGKEGTPNRRKAEIAAALAALEDGTVGDVAEPGLLTTDEEDSGNLAAVDPGDPLVEKLYDAFLLDDLVDLACRFGIKRRGVNWGKDGTPRRRKHDIIAALLAHHAQQQLEDLSPSDLIETEQGRTIKNQGMDRCNSDQPAETKQDIVSNEDESDAATEEEPQLQALVDLGHESSWCAYYVDDVQEEPHTGYMSRAAYRKRLQDAGLLQRDQDVFHIIASANGGPDHPDSYLGALGASFNRSIGCRFDALCCFIAGLEKTEKAVRRALEAERLYRSDPARKPRVYSKSPPVFYSENAYNLQAGRCLTGAELLERGRLTCYQACLRPVWPKLQSSRGLKEQQQQLQQ
ncbi:unnamed protein product [Polarella glacialis]|uniref:Uncharacterized protein n=1 Tax=Polarella glacialis TaxID=89957 RepID=A0A813I539_POLGL|nr:unnamed protein product [Polarella glacialis]